VGLPILVADDNAINCQILEELLTGWLLEPTIVQSGRAALAAFRQAMQEKNPFRLVLLDSEMPDPDGFAVCEEVRQHPAFPGAQILMLTSRDLARSVARAEELGTDYLVKPVRPAELLDTLARAATRGTSRGPVVEAEEIEPAVELPSLRILIADDSDVNRKLVFGVLGPRHQYVVALNGGDAVERFQSQEFDLVLMDVQMPGIDGFEAARRIRALERAAGGHVPIVAMTAHALKGDRDRCLAAGMDEYISKPMRARHLQETIAGALAAEQKRESASRITSSTPGRVADAPRSQSSEPIDWSVALQNVDGDRALLAKVVEAFQSETPGLLAGIRNAIRRGDREAIHRSVHTLRGSLGHFGAERAANVAARLDEEIHEDGGRNVEDTLAQLDAEVNRILETLKKHQREDAES
jgi:CheY-like chemotaxis protein/HPt (histidine-containing phosphotransfer) domain-containing protein